MNFDVHGDRAFLNTLIFGCIIGTEIRNYVWQRRLSYIRILNIYG